jgi:hypothetical protein
LNAVVRLAGASRNMRRAELWIQVRGWVV